MDRWKRWHPLVRKIAQLLTVRPEPGLTDDELADLALELAGTADRARAVQDLFYLIAALDAEGLTDLAAELFLVAEPFAPADAVHRLRAIDRAEAIAMRAKQFAAFARTPTPRPASAAQTSGVMRARDFLSSLIV